jgi:sec-independent protein translocase protein TatB
MFDIGWSELMVIAVVAIVVIGPKDLPRAMRTVGKWSGKMKRMARDFQNQFNEAIREAELDDVKKEVAAIAQIDPMADLKKDLAKTEAGIRTDLSTPATNGAVPPSVAGAASAADSDLAQLAADKGADEPAPTLTEAKVAETPAPEARVAAVTEKAT